MIDSKKPGQQLNADREPYVGPDPSSPAVVTSDASADTSSATQTREDAEKIVTREEPNPLQMPPYDIPRDSVEYKNWRQAQYHHGIRNLLLALLVFGGLGLLYWLMVTH